MSDPHLRTLSNAANARAVTHGGRCSAARVITCLNVFTHVASTLTLCVAFYIVVTKHFCMMAEKDHRIAADYM